MRTYDLETIHGVPSFLALTWIARAVRSSEIAYPATFASAPDSSTFQKGSGEVSERSGKGREKAAVSHVFAARADHHGELKLMLHFSDALWQHCTPLCVRRYRPRLDQRSCLRRPPSELLLSGVPLRAVGASKLIQQLFKQNQAGAPRWRVRSDQSDPPAPRSTSLAS